MRGARGEQPTLSPLLRLPWNGRVLMNWKASVAGGLLAGAVFVILEMGAAVWLHGAGVWRPLRMMAGLALGEGVVPVRGERAGFDLGVVAAGLYVHTVLSITYSMADSALLSRSGRWRVPAGAVTGLAIYLMNFYGFVALFPWFVDGRGWFTALVHVIFGVVAGATERLVEGCAWARE